MNDSLILIGGGGHALVVLDAARAAGIMVHGVLDDYTNPPACAGPDAPPLLGPITETDPLHIHPWIVCLGDPDTRRSLCTGLAAFTDRALSVIHPTAWVSPSARIGNGVYIGANAVVNARAVVADHVILNTGAIVEHECAIGTGTHIAPNATLGGAARVGTFALVGLGASVLPGVTVGARAVVGAGAVVTKPVADRTRVAGNPAREMTTQQR